jgi:hypothetical protein
VNVALRKVSPADGLLTRLLGREVDRQTGALGYFHAALLFRGNRGYNFSAHPLTGVGYEEDSYSPDQWAMFDLGRDEHELDVLKFAHSELRCGYDYLGVLRFVDRNVKPSPTRWFCSELVVACLQRARMFTYLKPEAISPNDLFRGLDALSKLPEYTRVRRIF